MVFGLFIRTEFECNRKGLSARLNGQIVCCLIVVLVLRRKPYRTLGKLERNDGRHVMGEILWHAVFTYLKR